MTRLSLDIIFNRLMHSSTTALGLNLAHSENSKQQIYGKFCHYSWHKLTAIYFYSLADNVPSQIFRRKKQERADAVSRNT